MSLAADALQPYVARQLAKSKGLTLDISLPDLIGKQKTIGFDLSFEIDKSISVADFRDESVIIASIASDSARLACAAFQTVRWASLCAASAGNMAWALISVYYSAYYAAHALMRLFGESCSYFDRSHITRIVALGSATGQGPPFRLEAGVHHCILNSTGTAVEFRNVRGASGGTHEAFWSLFGILVKRVTELILSGPLPSQDAQLVFLKMDELEKGMRAYGYTSYNWLSFIRNEIQYRHQFGVWFPHTVKRRDREQLHRLIEQWDRDPMAVDVEARHFVQLGRFVIVCVFIVSLCRTMWIRVAERTALGRGAGAARGPLAYLRQVRQV